MWKHGEVKVIKIGMDLQIHTYLEDKNKLLLIVLYSRSPR